MTAQRDSITPTAFKKPLRAELSALGIDPAKALKFLPSWWEDAIQHPSGIFEVRGFIAKHLGLQLAADGTLGLRTLPHACFKTTHHSNIDELAPARSLATAISKLIASIVIPNWSGALPDAPTVRQTVLDTGAPWVGLNELLDICWQNGIPVISLPTLPTGNRKMEGMVSYCLGRPVIFISKKPDLPAWLLFVLAHEMGHIASNHLPSTEGESIVDEEVSEDNSERDAQEAQANQYALEILTGADDGAFMITPPLPKAPRLAAIIRREGGNRNIDPGHLVLNIAKHPPRGKNIFPLAMNTLKLLQPGETGSSQCNDALKRNVDLDALSDDSFEFLEGLGII